MINLLIPLLWLVFILVYWLKKREVKIKWIKSGILAILVLFAVWGIYASWTTYNLWKNDPISRYLLPPYQGFTYIFQYTFYHFWLSGLVNLLVGLFWVIVLFLLSRYSKGRFLDKTDVWLGFFTALVAGWPGFIFYLFAVFGLFLTHQLIANFVYKTSEPIPITPYFVTGALIALILGNYFIQQFGLSVLKI